MRSGAESRKDAQATAVLLTPLAMVVTGIGGRTAGPVNCTSKIEQVDSLGVRKFSLGLTMTCSGERLGPVLNEADVRAKKVFLQNVVSISGVTDDRRLQLALQQGQTQIVAHKNSASFRNDFPADPIAGSRTRVTMS